jgi:hypothetical protein
MIAITVCATKSYTYAMRAQARRVLANIAATPNNRAAKGVVVLVGDTSAELKEIERLYKQILPEGWSVILNGYRDFAEGGESYKVQAQLLIAKMRTEAHSTARSLNVDYCWSLDSDVLPPPNALRCSLDSLQFDGGYYSVATCPYPNTAFIGGFGTRQNPIAEDFLPHERKMTPALQADLDANEAEAKRLREEKKQPDKETLKRWADTAKMIKENCPPDGTIWEIIAKHGHRRRGWLDNAYPAIGLGAMVPIDWCGFGCTLMNREALALANFDGYDGQGTEDLYICWHRWHPAGLRLNAIPHCPCDHVIWEAKKNGDPAKYIHFLTYHEQEGEHRGHLRIRKLPWQQFG